MSLDLDNFRYDSYQQLGNTNLQPKRLAITRVAGHGSRRTGHGSVKTGDRSKNGQRVKKNRVAGKKTVKAGKRKNSLCIQNLLPVCFKGINLLNARVIKKKP